MKTEIKEDDIARLFNKPLLFVGLGLAENEVFLRWLLIERAKYFRTFPDRAHDAWYVYVDDPSDERQAGKHFFLESVGIRCIEAGSYGEIYENSGWLAAPIALAPSSRLTYS